MSDGPRASPAGEPPALPGDGGGIAGIARRKHREYLMPAVANHYEESVVLVSVPYHATAQVGRDFAGELKGKVVLDTGNPYPSRDGEMAVRDRKRGTGVASKEYLPGTKLVRAFNAINAGPLANEALKKPERIGIPLASDHPDALKVAGQLVSDAGFDPVVVGDLARAREFDFGTAVYVRSYSAARIREVLGLK